VGEVARGEVPEVRADGEAHPERRGGESGGQGGGGGGFRSLGRRRRRQANPSGDATRREGREREGKFHLCESVQS
jgi:hypothetical protein